MFNQSGFSEAQQLGMAFLWITAVVYVVVSGVAYVLIRNKRRIYAIERSLQRLEVPLSPREARRMHESHGLIEYLFPWLLAVLLTVLGAFLTVEAGDLPVGRIAGQTQPASSGGNQLPTSMFYAFVGASVFTTQMIYRRYVAFDLKPAVYFFVSTRFIVAVATAFVAEMAFRTLSYGQEVVYMFGFFAGLFPEAALLWLRNWFRRHLPFNRQAESPPVPLTMIQGCNGYQQARLLEEGIEDAHNMATADITRLVVRTPFDLELLVDWVDQAVLYVHVPDGTLEELRKVGIRAISDFFEVFERSGGDVELVVKRIAEATGDRPGEPKVRADRLLLLYQTAYRDPNKEFVCRFWQHERERAVDPRVADEAGPAAVGAMAF